MLRASAVTCAGKWVAPSHPEYVVQSVSLTRARKASFRRMPRGWAGSRKSLRAA